MGQRPLRCELYSDKKNHSANAKQVAGIAFDFVLLSAGLAGLGYHVWYLRESQLVKLDQVRRILSFLSLCLLNGLALTSCSTAGLLNYCTPQRYG